MKREKEGVTLSYIKNVIWQAERGLGQETPVESLLTQYQTPVRRGRIPTYWKNRLTSGWTAC